MMLKEVNVNMMLIYHIVHEGSSCGVVGIMSAYDTVRFEFDSHRIQK